MRTLSLELADRIADAALAKGREARFAAAGLSADTGAPRA